ncbi:MAG: response regulator [Candidatus Pacearchaeota archaeon]
MAMNKILYVDDNRKNGEAARAVESRIVYAPSIASIPGSLRDYDCIITDMQMEHERSGMDLVERAVREGKLPWIASGGTYDHGGIFNRVRLFNPITIKIFNKMSKEEQRFWGEALPFIERNQNNPIQRSLEKVFSKLGTVPEFSFEQIMLLYNLHSRT